MNTRPTRFETLAGALAVLAWLIAVIVIEGSGDRGDETPAELLAYFEGNESSIYFGGMLFFVGSALMIWFGGVVRTAIAATGLDSLASIAQGSAVVLAVTSMGLIAPQIGAAFGASDAGELAPEAAQALWLAGDGFIVAAGAAAASLTACVGLATLRSRMLPAWFGWFSFVLALALVIPYAHWIATIFVTPVWILIVTGFLWSGATAGAREAPAEPALE